jgi:NADPH2:quinone reductase
MKAIRVHEHGGPEVLKLEEIAVPEPKEGQVLVRVKAIGVNPVDTYFRSGAYTTLSPLPYTPGSDAAGVIERAGPSVSLQPGQNVYTGASISGTYADLALCDAHSVYPLPPNVSFKEGAALGVPYATAYRALFHKGHAAAGETVLIHGATGGVGTAAVQLARAAGLRVIGSSGTEEGRKLALSNGAHEVLDHHDPKFAEKISALTNSRGLDLIIEMLSNVNLGTDLPLLAKFGRVIVVGSRGKVEINPRDAMSRDATIQAMTLFNATRDELRGIHAALYAGLENKTLRPIIGKEFPLAQAAQAHQAVLEPGAYGKILLIP